MTTFATIVTKSHIPWAFALCESITKFDDKAKLFILVTDLDRFEGDLCGLPVEFMYLNQLSNQKYFDELLVKYNNTPDYLRWSLKPILINYLIDNGHDKIVFCDCDILFFSSYQFIFDLLDNFNILLTPHFFDHNSPKNIQLLHTTGIINGGFVAVNSRGKDAMLWWAKMCLDKCNSDYGTINVDQGYLEFLPFFFKDVKILQHKGCNVSYWSNDFLKRSGENGTFFVTDEQTKSPLVFYHFAANKYNQFFNEEKEFYPILEYLQGLLSKYGFRKNVIDLGKLQLVNRHIPLMQRIRNKVVMSVPYRIYKIK